MLATIRRAEYVLVRAATSLPVPRLADVADKLPLHYHSDSTRHPERCQSG